MVADWFLKALWRMMFGVVGKLLPFGACRHIARPAGLLAWGMGFRREVIRKNLALAFPEYSQVDRDRLGRESLVNVATVGLEILTLRHLSSQQLQSVISVEDIQLLQSLGDRGGLLLSGHVGNWELLAFGAAAVSGIPFSIIIKSQKDFGELIRMRTARGNKVIPTHRSAREAAALLARGGVVAMLADQAATTEDDMTMMFGIPTCTYSAPARLALRFRPRVIIGFAQRNGDGRYHVRLEELLHDDLPDNPEGSQAFTQRYVERLETAIRQHPEQWLWGHRKWKNTKGVDY
jgi:Kdo2-lipid IVA lauroyltransferase/acyltransferase